MEFWKGWTLLTVLTFLKSEKKTKFFQKILTDFGYRLLDKKNLRYTFTVFEFLEQINFLLVKCNYFFSR